MKLNQSNVTIIRRLLVGRNTPPLLSILNRLEPADISQLFSDLDRRERDLLFDALLTIQKADRVLLSLPDVQVQELLLNLQTDRFLKLLRLAAEDSSAYFLSFIEDPEARQGLLKQLDAATRMKIERFLNYPADSAGRIMEPDVFSVPAHVTAEQGLHLLRMKAKEQSIYYIYCVNEQNQLVGILSLRQMATADSTMLLSDIMKKDVISVAPMTSSSDVAKIVSRYDFIALPVIDENKNLLGVVTVDDVVDIIQEQAAAEIYRRAGLQEDDRVYSAVSKKIRNRLPWMLLNFGTAVLASWVVSRFEETISKLILLASLNNIVAGMGGNTAIQTITVFTRGLAMGDFSAISVFKAMRREIAASVSVGLITGLVAGVFTYFWKGDILVAVVIATAMVINSFAASVSGAFVPVMLKKLGFDPASGTGVIVTTFTDVVGFLSFLGIATLGLKMRGAL